MHTSASLRRLAGAAGLGLLAAGLVGLPSTASANPAGTALVINEVYGGGGNSGATFTHDFIELYNPTDASISLDGLSVQYRSASGGGTGFTNLSGAVAAGGHFLIQQSAGAGGTTSLPTPDATGSLNMSGSTGTVALVAATGTVDLTSTAPIDMVGWGSGAVLREGSPAPGTSNSTSVARTEAGVDTDDNATDFTAGAPTPQNAGAEPPPPPPAPVERTIAEIQGTGPATTVPADQVVITRGVVTAAYPTGGFNGFYLQTGGPDTTPGASDGIFIYEPGFPDWITVGDSVEVEGLVSEFGSQTQIAADRITELATALPAVVPNTVVPGTECALPGTECLTGADLDAAREEFEGELFLPTAPVTVTDSYDFGITSSSFFGEIGLAFDSSIPLVTPTEVVDAQDTAGIEARTAYNQAHLVVLDDGSSTAYWNTQNTAAGQDLPLPWLTAEHTVRVGASVTFQKPLVLDYRFGWKLQPQRQVIGEPTGLMTFEQDRPAKPAEVGGDLKLATFNVLNYFTTLGGDVPGCSAYVDRDDEPVATRSCTSANGPRGAWDQADFERQQAKIVRAINTMDADVVSLEELENSKAVDGGDRDEALASLVGALNADAGTVRWAYAPSPADLPASEDVIRTGFIYDPGTVELVGESQIHDVDAFDNAREPLAQVFRAKGSAEDQSFAVIVNHFKSKGSGADDGTGQGNANPDRIRQAEALATFAAAFAAARGTDKVFLTGDFNAYSQEDPVQVIEAAGYTKLESTDDPNEWSYSFGGTSGSLDHVFANAPAKAMVTGVDLWEINANEPLYYQYSRFNYVGTELYRPDVFASSDHNPEIVGLKVARAQQPEPPAPAPVTVSASVTPKRIVVDRTEPMVHVRLTRTDGTKVTSGTVEVVDGGQVIASAAVGNSGVVNVKLPARTRVGTDELVVRHVSGGQTAQTTVSLTVRKAASTLKRAQLTKKIKAGRTVVKLKVKARDELGGKASGKVRFKVRGTWRVTQLRNGRATLRLGKFARKGRYPVVVKYLGDRGTRKDTLRLKVRVR